MPTKRNLPFSGVPIHGEALGHFFMQTRAPHKMGSRAPRHFRWSKNGGRHPARFRKRFHDGAWTTRLTILEVWTRTIQTTPMYITARTHSKKGKTGNKAIRVDHKERSQALSAKSVLRLLEKFVRQPLHARPKAGWGMCIRDTVGS